MLRNAILLVDNSQVLMDLTRKTLERSGYNVRCAAGLEVMREHLATFAPDVIVLDQKLPDGTGIDMCRELRNHYTTPIMFTSDTKDDEFPSLQAGASDFLKKPFDYEIFKARIAALLNREVRDSYVHRTFELISERA